MKPKARSLKKKKKKKTQHLFKLPYLPRKRQRVRMQDRIQITNIGT